MPHATFVTGGTSWITPSRLPRHHPELNLVGDGSLRPGGGEPDLHPPQRTVAADVGDLPDAVLVVLHDLACGIVAVGLRRRRTGFRPRGGADRVAGGGRGLRDLRSPFFQ